MIEVGEIVTRIWGDGFMRTQMRVSAIDDEFIYCDAQRKNEKTVWTVIPADQPHWKFDKQFGVETDEEQGWGIEPYGRNLMLSHIERME